MKLITCIFIVLIYCQHALAGESSFTLREKAVQNAIDRESILEQVHQEDQEQTERIKQAKEQMQSAQTENERRYYELDYYEHSALRLRAWLNGFHGLLTELDKDIVALRSREQAIQDATSKQGKAEIEGLRNILVHLTGVRLDGKDGKAVFAVSRGASTDIYATRQKLLALTYMNLLRAMDSKRHKQNLVMLQRAKTQLEKEVDGYIAEYKQLKNQYRRLNNG